MTDIHENIRTIVATIDAHDAGIYPDGIYTCPCKFRGTETEWHIHVADKILEAIDPAVQETLI